MNDQVFADEVGDIIVSGTIVRFDLMIRSTTEKESGGKPKLVAQQRVIMPIDAFLRAVNLMQSSVQDMLKKGVISRAPKKGSAPNDPASSPPKK